MRDFWVCVFTQADARHAQAQANEDKNDASLTPCDTSADSYRW